MKCLRLCLLFSLPFFGFAQQNNTWVTQPDSVIIYPQQALIRSQVLVQLPTGKSTFFLTGLGASLQTQSVQVTSQGDWKILSVNVEKSAQTAHRSAAQDSILAIDKEIRKLEMQIRVTDQQEKIIMANASIKSESDGLIPEDFKEFMALFEKKFTEIGKKRLALHEQLVLAQARRKNWEEPIKLIPNPTDEAPVIRILAESPRAMTVAVSLAYVVSQASWTPHYTARVQDTNQPLAVTFQADIQQQTGLDWTKAHVTLSTAQPVLGGQKPAITPEFLQIYQPRVAYRREAKMSSEPMVMAMATDVAPPPPAQEVVLENFDLFMQYTLPGLQRIPHGGSPTRLDVQSFTWQPKYSYSLVPRQSTDGYVQAELPYEVLKNLSPGPLTLFWKGTFLGESYLDTRQSEQPSALSLGRDQSLHVKVDEIMDKKSFRTIGQAVRETQVFRYTVTNRKTQSVLVKIEDQIPVSQDSRIEVTSETTPEGKIIPESGLLQWEIAIPAGGTVVLEKSIHLKYPKGLRLQRVPGWN